MRDLFPGYYRPKDEEFDEIWKECIFTFDANILLNIYRYTPETRKRLFDISSKLKDRISVPHQAAYEYQKERPNVISQQIKAYSEIQKLLDENLQKLKDGLSKYEKHSFININEIKAIVEEAIQKTGDTLNKAKLQHPKFLKHDDLQDTLTDLLSGNIGNSYNEKDLEDIYKEAEERFKAKQPPGYMDAANKEAPEKYGDFVIWKQLINYAISQKKPLIFVTDDAKEDWWWEHQGETLGPRPELVKEMLSIASVRFYMYSSDRFLKYAEEFLNLPHKQEVIDEAREIRYQNEAYQYSQELQKSLAIIINPSISESFNSSISKIMQSMAKEMQRVLIDQKLGEMRRIASESKTRQNNTDSDLSLQ